MIYRRYINISGTKYYIRLLRVQCKTCGKTHAILPNFIVPYLHEPILTAAMVDRLTCRAHVINIMGDSYRMRETKEWLSK